MSVMIMTQKPETEADLPEPDLPEPDLPEPDLSEPDLAEPALPDRVSDITRAGGPRIQPVLVGFVLATIIGMISVAAFWTR